MTGAIVMEAAVPPVPANVAVIAISDGAPPGIPNPVNALSGPVRRHLYSSLRSALHDPSVSSVILIGSGRDERGSGGGGGGGNFSAGADIREFSSSLSSDGGGGGGGGGGTTTAAASPPDAASDPPPTLRELCDLVESSHKPIVAALSGTCLGGGMELALSAHYRVSDRTLRYGLPEVRIGLLPGAGGTQRLPRLVGVRESLDAILRGGIDRGSDAGLASGFLDGVVAAAAGDGDEESVLDCAVRWAVRAASTSTTPGELDGRRLRRRDVPDDKDGMANGDMCDIALSSLPPREKGGESAHACLEAVRASFRDGLSFDGGMDVEKSLFNDLLYHSLQGRAYRHVFFAERRSSSSSSSLPSDKGKKHSTSSNDGLKMGKGAVGVIGAGTMGRGIAASFLRAGYGPVILVDVNPVGLEAGVNDIRSILQSESKRGKLDPSKLEAALSNLASSTDLSSVAKCDLVVEAAYENLEVKRMIFSKLDVIVSRRDALILSNTSTLDVDAIASSLSPDRRPYCAGMHFFSPAHVMKLVEVVRGSETSADTLNVIRAATRRIKKVPVVVGNCDGFVGNRMMHPYVTESTLLLADYGGGRSGLGVGDIDDAMGPGYFGVAVGPFVMSDIAGNDIGYNIRREKGLLRDPKTGIVGPNRKQIRYTELADEMVEKLGRLGQKSKNGWYDYDPKVGKGRKPLTSSEMQELIDKYSMHSPQRGIKLSRDEIVHRIALPLVNEGFKILEEGIASDPSDIDIIYLYGYGWPAWRGGPMFWADNYVGLPRVLNELEKFHRMHPNSEYYRPSELLRRCVDLGVGVQEYYKKGLAATSPESTNSKL